jgi:hypothetical protein
MPVVLGIFSPKANLKLLRKCKTSNRIRLHALSLTLGVLHHFDLFAEIRGVGGRAFLFAAYIAS